MLLHEVTLIKLQDFFISNKDHVKNRIWLQPIVIGNKILIFKQKLFIKKL